MSKRTTLIFTILLGYIVLQFLWWEVLLVRQSNDNISKEQKIAALSSPDNEIIIRDIAKLEQKKMKRVYMIVGEGSVFLLILLLGASLVRKSVRRETELANQQKNFILSISHELKTPIAASKLQLQTLLKHELDREKQKQLLSNALNETERLHKLVDNVLLANQIENDNLSIQKEELNMSELLQQTMSRYFQLQLDTQFIKLHIEQGIVYAGDKDLLPSVFINLVENAIKYSFETVDIEVVLRIVNSKPLLEVKDKGCGVSQPEKEKIFDKFFRSGNEDTRKTKGTGIGLYIVKRICNLHQAKIKVTDNTPSGSIFAVQF
ncbi:MAG: HAMP domain-containing sensor histidine kinase [Bacteroidota bacterium]